MNPTRLLWGIVLAAVVTALGLPRAASADTTVSVTTNWAQYGVLQLDLFRLEAGAGALTLLLEGDGSEAPLAIGLFRGTGEPVWSMVEPVPGQMAVEITLAEGGAFDLFVVDNQLLSLTVTAPGLVMHPVTPAIRMPEWEPYGLHNEPFTFAPDVPNWGVTQWLAIDLNGEPLAENALGPDGRTDGVYIDTLALADGIHELSVGAKALEAENYAFSMVEFVVDRVDAFPDVPATHWARHYVEVLFHLGIVNGREGGYHPADPVTRAEYAALLARTLELEASPDAQNLFADMQNHWALPYVLALYEAGLVTGESVDGQLYFHPQRTINRAEAATILGRTLQVSDAPLPDEPLFTDWAAVPDWARPSVAALSKMGWVNGFPDGTYQPGANLQRDQVAKLMAKFFGL